MKYAPKKVFILKDGKYTEISYEELCSRKESDETYMDKLFLPMHGMLMEVTEETYAEYYREKRRQKYIDERARANGEILYDALSTDEFNGEDILIDPQPGVYEQVELWADKEKLRIVLALLSEEEKRLIEELFYKEMSERQLAQKYGISQVAIHKRKIRILAKLKKLFEK